MGGRQVGPARLRRGGLNAAESVLNTSRRRRPVKPALQRRCPLSSPLDGCFLRGGQCGGHLHPPRRHGSGPSRDPCNGSRQRGNDGATTQSHHCVQYARDYIRRTQWCSVQPSGPGTSPQREEGCRRVFGVRRESLLGAAGDERVRACIGSGGCAVRGSLRGAAGSVRVNASDSIMRRRPIRAADASHRARSPGPARGARGTAMAPPSSGGHRSVGGLSRQRPKRVQRHSPSCVAALPEQPGSRCVCSLRWQPLRFPTRVRRRGSASC